MAQPARDDIQSGIICKLVGRKFYGFIATESTEDKPYGIFFHGSALVGGLPFDSLREGQLVRYKTHVNPVNGSVRAVDVELLEAPVPAPLTTRVGVISSMVMTRRFGFITPFDFGPNIFFHWSAVVDPAGFDDLREGDEVAYLPVIDTKGRPKAVGVTR